MNKVVQTFKYRTAYDIQLSKLNTQVNNQTQVWDPSHNFHLQLWSHKKQLEKMKALKKKTSILVQWCVVSCYYWETVWFCLSLGPYYISGRERTGW